MPGSFASLHYHIVFGARDRLPLITTDLAAPLHAYVAGVVKGIGGKAIVIGGPADHVHILVPLPRDKAIADAVREIKASTTRWVHRTYPGHRGFAWQDWYGAFTISCTGTDRVKAYIEAQQEHHREVTFREEFLTFLRHHQIEFDERYVVSRRLCRPFQGLLYHWGRESTGSASLHPWLTMCGPLCGLNAAYPSGVSKQTGQPSPPVQHPRRRQGVAGTERGRG